MVPKNIESGICILCGEETEGVPAEKDFIISSARKIRAILKMPAKKSVACGKCLPECAKKRGAFEKKVKNYRIAAGIFALLVLSGTVVSRQLGMGTFFAAVVGAAFILTLPFAAYFPKFKETAT